MSIATPPRSVHPRGPGGPPASSPGLRPSSSAATIDPMRVLRRHMLAIIASAFVGGVLGVGAYLGFLYLYPLYSGQVLFEVQPGLQTAGQVGTFDATNDETVFRLAQTETYMLTSREILNEAMKNPDILQTEWHKKFLTSTSDGRQSFDHNKAVDELKKKISAGAIRSSNLFHLSWSTHNKSDVPIVLNAIAKTYMDERERRDRAVYDRNLVLFKGQSKITENELDDLAKEMVKLIRDHNMTNLDNVYQSAQAYRMQEITRELAQVTSAYNVSLSNLNLVSEQLRGTLEPTSMDVWEAERDHSLLSVIESIQHQHANLRRLYTTRDPEDALVRKTEEQIRGYEEQRDAKIKEIIRRNLEAKHRQFANDVERFGSTAMTLEQELEKLNNMLKDLTAQQSQYEALKTRRDHLEAKRTADLQLINEVELMRFRADASRVRQAQRALTPRELSFPKPEIVIPLGVLLMIGLTIGFVFVREMMDQRVKSASDLAVLPGANVLGSIPDLEDDPTRTPEAELVVRKHPMSVVAESYRQATASLLPMLDRSGHQTLLLVGGLPGAGTTTVATNIASSIAAAGKRVLVVDANFRRPRLAQAMGLSGDGLGLADVISNNATLSQAIVEREGVHVMPVGSAANRVSDRLNGFIFDSMLAELRGKYDLVVFDAPPAVVSGDALIIANKVDAAVMVVRANQEHRGLVARMMQRLGGARCELLGLLLNRPLGIAGGYLKKNYATMAEYSAGA